MWGESIPEVEFGWNNTSTFDLDGAVSNKSSKCLHREVLHVPVNPEITEIQTTPHICSLIYVIL